jgi:hypothetical protein
MTRPRGSLPLCFSLSSIPLSLSLSRVPQAFPLIYKRESWAPLHGEKRKSDFKHTQLTSFIETWDILPLSPVCNPYCKHRAGNMSSIALDVWTFCPN